MEINTYEICAECKFHYVLGVHEYSTCPHCALEKRIKTLEDKVLLLEARNEHLDEIESEGEW